MEEESIVSEPPSLPTHTMKPIILKCENITKEYEIGDYIVRALDSINFQVNRGEFIVFQGASGAGKSTLLSLISGLDTPTKGSVQIEWVQVSDLSEESMSLFRMATIGFIFQNYNLISSLTAEENILFPMQLAQMETNLMQQRAQLLLGKIGLTERSEHLPFQLSAGEQQRIGIARALANNPPIILADEPTANLDKKTSTLIADLLLEMNQEGKTIIVATHDDKLISKAHRVFSIEDGKITNELKQKSPPDIKEMLVPDNYIPCPNCALFLPPGASSCGFCGASFIHKE